jgi:hypothetical protein
MNDLNSGLQDPLKEEQKPEEVQLGDLLQKIKQIDKEGEPFFGRCRKICKIGNYQFILGPGFQPTFSLAMFILFTFIIFPFSPMILHTKRLTVGTAVNGVFHLLALLCLVRTSFMDPGFVTRKPDPSLAAEHPERFSCPDCLLPQEEAIEEDYTHCRDCLRCVPKLDHHCPVLGMCIAKNNLWSFYGLLTCFIVFMSSFYLIFLGEVK